MNDDERVALENWTKKLAEALDLADLPVDIDQILNLAGDAARAIVRPAAPVTTFFVGYAAGFAAASGISPANATNDATLAAVALAKAQ